MDPAPLLYLPDEDANVSSFGVLASKQGEPQFLGAFHHMELDHFAFLLTQNSIGTVRTTRQLPIN